MESLKYWLLTSTIAHVVLLAILFFMPDFTPRLVIGENQIVGRFIPGEPAPEGSGGGPQEDNSGDEAEPPTPEPKESPEEDILPPTPEPEAQPTLISLGPTPKPVKATPTQSASKRTPTPTPPEGASTRVPTPTRTRKPNYAALANLAEQIKSDRQKVPTAKPTAADAPGPTASPASSAGTQGTGANVSIGNNPGIGDGGPGVIGGTGSNPNAKGAAGTSDGVIGFSGQVTDAFTSQLWAELTAAMKREAPAVNKVFTAEVKFVMKKDGSVKSVAINKSSGSTNVDEACKRAVNTAKLPPLTGHYSGDELTVTASMTARP